MDGFAPPSAVYASGSWAGFEVRSKDLMSGTILDHKETVTAECMEPPFLQVCVRLTEGEAPEDRDP